MKFRKLNLDELPPIMLAFSGILGVAPMGVFRLFEGNFVIAIIDFIAVVAFAAVAWAVYAKGLVRIGSICMAFVAIITTTVTVSIRGGDHILWMYPATVALFYLLRPKEASVVSLIAISLVLPVVFDGRDSSQIALYLAALGVTISLSVAFATLTAEQRREMQKTSLTDPLTGIGNRRALDDTLDDMINEVTDRSRSFVLIMFDIDHFKSVNDTYGHSIGDKVLRGVAEVVGGSVRPSDAFFRAGGEEFVVLANNADLKQGKHLAERLRVAIAELKHPLGQPEDCVHVTASFGLAEYRDGESRDTLYRRTDEALYEAKRSGRNRLHLADRTASLSGTASYAALTDDGHENADTETLSEAS
ncbi:MAG: GGDEF domain-containing protein [Pseudomonadota bacterium]